MYIIFTDSVSLFLNGFVSERAQFLYSPLLLWEEEGNTERKRDRGKWSNQITRCISFATFASTCPSIRLMPPLPPAPAADFLGSFLLLFEATLKFYFFRPTFFKFHYCALWNFNMNFILSIWKVGRYRMQNELCSSLRSPPAVTKKHFRMEMLENHLMIKYYIFRTLIIDCWHQTMFLRSMFPMMSLFAFNSKFISWASAPYGSIWVRYTLRRFTICICLIVKV